MKVPISRNHQRMRFCGYYTKFSLFWCTLLLHHTSHISCASLGQFSAKPTDLGLSQNNTKSSNLSELIEFSPSNFTAEIENTTILSDEVESDSIPKITLKLRTQLRVENKKNTNQSTESFKESNETVKFISNATKDTLIDIEYIGNIQDEIELDDTNSWKKKWTTRGKVEKINSVKERDVKSDFVAEESKSLVEDEIPKTIELLLESENSEENKITEKEMKRSESAKGRQFVFHPYLSPIYGKDIPPDEKISIKDVFPIKMVKFVKSMVEEAPWEQMFIKMVRMVVDQFVDKIIEKMFADKGGDHFKKRSIDMFLSPTWVLPTFETPVVRLKRSIKSKNHPQQDEDSFSYIPPPKRIPQEAGVKEKKTAEERMTLLDHFLDFVFPNSKSNVSDDEIFDRLKKRDTRNTHIFKTLVALFLSSFEKTSGIITDVKDNLRYKMLKEFLPYLYQKRFSKPDTQQGSSNAVDGLRMSHRKMSEILQKRNDVLESIPERSERRKRSASGHSSKEEDRLWQGTSRRHKPLHQRSRDDCSLRKACNAGRFLSRLPSVQDITLQLREYGNEPHWDALIWGMKKKRCSRIFCKRQRSPKGSKHRWDPEKDRPSRKIEIVTDPPDDELDGINDATS